MTIAAHNLISSFNHAHKNEQLQTIQKSKKAKEVEQLIAENESLQRKLQSQEDEFRLQNETLMQELGSVSYNYFRIVVN